MTEVPENIVIGACNLLDAIKSEWGDQWSEWDQSIRDGLSKALAAAPPASPAPVDDGERVETRQRNADDMGLPPADAFYKAKAALAAINGDK